MQCCIPLICYSCISSFFGIQLNNCLELVIAPIVAELHIRLSRLLVLIVLSNRFFKILQGISFVT